MKDILTVVLESSQQIDSTWLDNEKPVKTRDGRQAIVLDIDISKVPNIIKGQVKVGDKMCDYEWDDTGKCLRASDERGNPQRPSDKDTLVKNF